MTRQRLVYALRLYEFHKAELRSFITVFFCRSALNNDTWTRLQNGATHKVSVFGEDLRHSQLDSDNSVDRHFLFSLFRSLSAPGEYWLRTAQILTTALLRCVTERLDFDVHARRQIELHQSVHRIRGRLENVDQALVRAHFKLFAGLLIHVRRTEHGPAVNRGGQRNRAGNICAGTLRRFHNFSRGLVQDAVVKCFQTNSNFIALSHVYSFRRLLNNLCNSAGADSVAAFANCETQP